MVLKLFIIKYPKKNKIQKNYKKMEGLDLLVTSSIVIFDIENRSFEEVEIE